VVPQDEAPEDLATVAGEFPDRLLTDGEAGRSADVPMIPPCGFRNDRIGKE